MLLCPAKMAALEQAARPEEQAMAYLNIRLKIRAIHYGPASRIAVVAGRELMNTGRVRVLNKDTTAVRAALMAATATHGEVIKNHIPLAAVAAVTVADGVAAMGAVTRQHIMVRVPAVANILQNFSTMAAAAIRV